MQTVGRALEQAPLMDRPCLLKRPPKPRAPPTSGGRPDRTDGQLDFAIGSGVQADGMALRILVVEDEPAIADTIT
jgi:hypothetical protein